MESKPLWKLKPIGWIAIVIGIGIALGSAASGGDIYILATGLLFILAGGLAKQETPTQTCPHCRSEVDAQATICPRCTREIKQR